MHFVLDCLRMFSFSNVLRLTLTNKILFLSMLAFGEELKTIGLYSYDKIFFTNSDINNALVFETHWSHSVLGCSLFCSKLNSESFYFIEKYEQNCLCNKALDNNVVFSENKTSVIYGYTENGLKVCRNSTFTARYHRPTSATVDDCLQLYKNGVVDDGLYIILGTVETWCDMTNGGWTVIQRRQDGSENFYRPWDDYVNGFGNRTGEYWIGLENIYQLILENSSLRIEMDTFGDVTPLRAYAEYTVFKVSPAVDRYRLTIGGFSGDCGDALGSIHNGYVFATYDKDRGGCAFKYKGAWWYSYCHHSNLNGPYASGKHTTLGLGMNWEQCWGHFYSVKTSVMKVKRIIKDHC